MFGGVKRVLGKEKVLFVGKRLWSAAFTCSSLFFLLWFVCGGSYSVETFLNCKLAWILFWAVTLAAVPLLSFLTYTHKMLPFPSLHFLIKADGDRERERERERSPELWVLYNTQKHYSVSRASRDSKCRLCFFVTAKYWEGFCDTDSVMLGKTQHLITRASVSLHLSFKHCKHARITDNNTSVNCCRDNKAQGCKTY